MDMLTRATITTTTAGRNVADQSIKRSKSATTSKRCTDSFFSRSSANDPISHRAEEEKKRGDAEDLRGIEERGQAEDDTDNMTKEALRQVMGFVFFAIFYLWRCQLWFDNTQANTVMVRGIT